MTDVELQYPWALIFLVLLPITFYLKRKYHNKTGFSAVALVNRNLQPNLVKKYLPDVLGMLVILSVTLALVNVQYSSIWQKSYLESKWIMIVQDLSGSMNRASSERGLTLGDVALHGAQAFINMRHKDDLIGAIAFSSYAKLISAPTFDKDILKEKLGLLSRESDSIVFRELTIGGATNASYATWLALCTFFMLLPEENRLSFDELKDFRYSLLGNTLKKVEIPEKLEKIKFGHGMAIVLFTDGRIEANKKDDDVRRGLPNFVNVVKLIERLGVKLYLIVVGGEVNDEVQTAIEGQEGTKSVGKIFYMPRRFSLDKMKEVYKNINELEKNKLLVKMYKKKKETRWLFTGLGMCILTMYIFVLRSPWFKKI